MKDTYIPGIVFRNLDKGQFAWIPWDLGGSIIARVYPRMQVFFATRWTG